MAVWQPGQKLYLPPVPVSKALCTESFVKRKSIYYHGETERLLTVGNPWFALKSPAVPKVSANQYRVFRVKLPDPNQFALPDKTIHDPVKERLVWSVLGVQVSRGGPLGIPVTGHYLFDTWIDAENAGKRNEQKGSDHRKLMGMDVKQCQLLLIGCRPAIGEYWDKAQTCQPEPAKGSCPPIELKNKPIEDGDMMDIGFGACNFKELNLDRSQVPVELTNSISVYPDYLKMSEEATGDYCFFFARRENMYVRHVYNRGGNMKEKFSEDLYLRMSLDERTEHSIALLGTPSGSLVSTDGQILNRPYWLYQAQGMNNGVCWENELFLTVGDNTRGGNLSISTFPNGAPQDSYSNMNVYVRHTEEYKLSFIFELCSVPLTAENMAYLHTFYPSVLEHWEIGVQPPPSSVLEDTYRFLDSAATKCPVPAPPEKSKDKYDKLKFWDVDLTEKLSLDLDQFALGRRFLAQNGVSCSVRKRKASTVSKQVVKRKKGAK